MDEKDMIAKSKYLSLVLRHKPEVAGLTMDKNGWADVRAITSHKHWDISLSELEEIVEKNNKKRFEFNEDKTKIRARQGHSIEVDVELKETCPPEILYHGTATRFLDSIKKKGLIKGTRNHVHLSSCGNTALIVGKRHGKARVLIIKAQEMSRDGYKFYLSNNDVWLTDNVPYKYIEHDGLYETQY